MKILLVNDYGYEAGGAEVIVYTLRDQLRSRGHLVRVFASSAWDGTLPMLADDLCHGTLDEPRTHLQCMNRSAYRALRQVITSFRPDVVHVNLYLTQLSPFILPALRDLPSTYYAHWYRAICPLGTRHLPCGDTCKFPIGIACLKQGCIPRHYWPPLMAQMAINRIWLGNFTRIMAVSQAVANRLAIHGGRAMQAATVLYPGTKSAQRRSHLEIDPVARIVCAGRLVPEKGIEVLIRAFRRVSTHHPDILLSVVGDGPCRSSLENLVQQLRLDSQVEFFGHLPQPQTLDLIRQSWCVCVPSLWEEPFGMVAVEAHMQGVPVIASMVGGLAEIVKEGTTGFLVPPGDVNALAARLAMIISNKSMVEEMGAQSHQRAVMEFSAEVFAQRFEHIYQEITLGQRGDDV